MRLNIFNAKNLKDWRALTSSNFKIPYTKIIANDFFRSLNLPQLDKFRKLMVGKDWTDLGDIGNVDKFSWIELVRILGYDGYQDHEGQNTLGIFSINKLLITGYISGENYKNKNFTIIPVKT